MAGQGVQTGAVGSGPQKRGLRWTRWPVAVDKMRGWGKQPEGQGAQEWEGEAAEGMEEGPFPVGRAPSGQGPQAVWLRACLPACVGKLRGSAVTPSYSQPLSFYGSGSELRRRTALQSEI